MKKSSFVKLIALISAGVLFLAGCGQKTVEVTEWEEGEGTVEQVQHSSGTQGSTSTLTSIDKNTVNLSLSDKDTVDKTTATGKTYDLKGAEVIYATYGEEKSTDMTTNEGKMIAAIEKKYNCVLKYRVAASSMAHYGELAAAAQSGQHFGDIARQSTGYGHTIQPRMGYWAPLSDFLDTSEPIFNQFARKELQYNGKDYFIVMTNRWYTPAALFFNKAIFNKFKVPTPDTYVDSNTWTVETFLEVARKLTKKDGDTQYYGFGVNNGAITVFAENVFGGQEIIEKDGKKIYAPDQKYLEGIQFASDLVWKYEVCNSTDLSKRGDVYLSTGTVAMSYAAVRYSDEAMSAIGPENLGLTWMPRTANGTHKAVVDETTCYGILSASEKENWEAYGQILRDLKYPYRGCSTLEQQCEAYAGDEKSLQTLMEMTKNGNENMHLTPIYADDIRKVQVSCKGVDTKTSPQAYFDSVKAGCQLVLDEFWQQ